MEPIVAAAEAGDVETVRKLLKSDPKMDYFVAARRGAALHAASVSGHADIVALLLAHDADTAVADEDVRLQIEVAISRGRADALLDSVENGNEAVVELLLAHHPTYVNVVDEQDCTPLHRAAYAGRRAVAEMLIKQGAAVDGPADVEWTPLHCAAVNGHSDVAELLLANKADVNAGRGIGGWTPLHDAALAGHSEMAELLLAHNADVNSKTDNGETPLTIASGKGHSAVVALLRQNGGE
jgi:ankyrin repeat protein